MRGRERGRLLRAFYLRTANAGKGEGKSADAKANKGKASSDSFTIESCKEDPGELSLGAFLCERVMDA